MRQNSTSPEQSVRLGTEYARSIARNRPRRRKSRSWTGYFDHPLAPVLALGIIAAGAMILWPRQANGNWREEHDGDVDYADFPPRGRMGRSGRGSFDESYNYID
ncbi:MAG: hypothetical protein Q8M31_18090 [Beijerinckiaceae bacterium]|nr:hypothetical protein [Beijerinckiaceae bacterium]